MPGLIVWNAFGSVELSQSSFDFGQEYEPLNGVVDGSVWRHCLERLDYAIAGKWLQHGSCNAHFAAGEKYHLVILLANNRKGHFACSE